MSAKAAIKTVWKATAIPEEIHDYARVVATLEKKPIGYLLGDILKPILKPRHDEALKRAAKNGGLKFKRNGKTSR